MANVPGGHADNGRGECHRSIQIPCLDNFNRRYAVTLRAFPEQGEHGQVRLLLKLGEAAWLSPEEARLLAEKLVVCADRVEELRVQARRVAEERAATTAIPDPP